jgi:hypothetical protein
LFPFYSRATGGCFLQLEFVDANNLNNIWRLDNPALSSKPLTYLSNNAQKHQAQSSPYDLGFIFCNSSTLVCVSFSESYSFYIVKFKSDVLCQPNASWSTRQRRPSELRAAHSA